MSSFSQVSSGLSQYHHNNLYFIQKMLAELDEEKTSDSEKNIKRENSGSKCNNLTIN